MAMSMDTFDDDKQGKKRKVLVPNRIGTRTRKLTVIATINSPQPAANRLLDLRSLGLYSTKRDSTGTFNPSDIRYASTELLLVICPKSKYTAPALFASGLRLDDDERHITSSYQPLRSRSISSSSINMWGQRKDCNMRKGKPASNMRAMMEIKTCVDRGRNATCGRVSLIRTCVRG